MIRVALKRPSPWTVVFCGVKWCLLYKGEKNIILGGEL